MLFLSRRDKTKVAQQFIAGKIVSGGKVPQARLTLGIDQPGFFSRPNGTELHDSRNPSNKLLGYFRFVPPGTSA